MTALLDDRCRFFLLEPWRWYVEEAEVAVDARVVPTPAWCRLDEETATATGYLADEMDWERRALAPSEAVATHAEVDDAADLR